MRAALLLAATVVVANARPTWRADHAIMPASAISPTVTKNTARARASQPYTPTLANSNLYAHTGVSQEMAARARARHRRAPATFQSTSQQNAPAPWPDPRLPAAPARQPPLCCALLHTSANFCTTACEQPAHARAHKCTFPAFGRGLRGLKTRDSDHRHRIVPPQPHRTASQPHRNRIATASPPHRHRCLLYTSPSPRDRTRSRMPSSA